MIRIIVALLLLTTLASSQIKIFGTADAPAEKTTITNTTAVTSRFVRLEKVHTLDGMSSLFVGGDLTSGSHAEGMLVEMQVGCCRTDDGDTLTGDWQTLETVATGYLGLTFGGGAQITGRQLSLGDLATTWNKFYLIRFRFSFATSTHTTDVIAYLSTN